MSFGWSIDAFIIFLQQTLDEMKSFSQISEARGSMSSSAAKIMQKEISDFNKKMNGKIPEEVSLATSILNKYSIYDKDLIVRMINSTKSEQNRITDELSMDTRDAEQLFFLLKKIDKSGKTRLIPMMMSKGERDDLEAGRKATDDVTMDLETEKGRSAVVKMYASLVYSIASKFVGKSGLDRAELISAGLEGLTMAMNSYRRPGTDDIENLGIDDEQKKEGTKVKGLTFRQYAGWCIRNRILTEINQNSRTVRINSYAYNKMKETGDVSRSFIASIDQMSSSDGDVDIDRLRIQDLSEEPDVFKRDQSKDDDRFKELYKIIDEKFPTKKATIFYRIFGINGYKQTSARTIGAEMGLSEIRVSQIKKEIIVYLKSNKKAMEILDMLTEMYTENLMCELFNLGKDAIYESIVSDDLYVLLESVTKWNSKSRLTSSVSNALASMDKNDADYIVKCISGGFDYIDSTYRSNKTTIVDFLNAMDPTENLVRRSDAFILDKMSEIADLCNKYGIY